ncbi:MAG: hypothetical protein AB7Q00_04675 [Phycisphaerales bacterium]
MRVIPKSVDGTLEFCGTHAPVWEAAATQGSIGITPAQVAELQSLTTLAIEARHTAEAARLAAITATSESNEAQRALRERALVLVQAIKAHAALASDPDAVLAAAALPTSRTTRGETIPPSTPRDLSAALNGDGSVTLSFTADHAATSDGVRFEIRRKIPALNETTYIVVGATPGTTARSRRITFTDTTIPPEAAHGGAVYLVRPARGTHLGDDSPPIVVQFGVGRGTNTRAASARATGAPAITGHAA